MGLYNAIFGYGDHAPEILVCLQVTPQFFDRFRDALVTNGEFAVYTRLGGGNREAYQKTIDKIREHPLYLRDVDDKFDSTYATFYFRIPDDVKEQFAPYDVGTFDPDARWKQAINGMKNPAEAQRVADRLPQFVTVIDPNKKSDA